MTQSTISLSAQTICEQAKIASEQWKQITLEQRKLLLLDIITTLKKLDQKLSDSVQYQSEFSAHLADQVTMMPGPTGETNELYFAPRGTCLFIVEPKQVAHTQAVMMSVFASLACALATGNSVIICCDDDELMQTLSELQNILPDHLIQLTTYQQHQALIQAEIQLAVLVARSEQQIEINRLLASRQGMIVPVVALAPEQDHLLKDPMLALRFVTERVRTINITAVGGNATLLELGSEH